MIRRLINGLIDIIYPKKCLACDKKLDASAAGASVIHYSQDKLLRDRPAGDFICGGCWDGIKRNLPPFCHSCGRRLEKTSFSKNICPRCVKKKLHFDRAFSPCVYTGVTKELIHEFKYKNKDYLGSPLSGLMAEFIREYNLPMDCLDFIVPIPLHKTKLREREFNQAEVLSKYIAKEFRKDLLVGALLRHRPTKTQTGLETNERFLNVKGSFSVKKPGDVKGKNLLIVDDVLTTGATSSEAARALKDAGANIVFILTLAN
ncbi:MAG: ComF family protein [Candidatus Omnitrophota bacterium]